MPDEITFIDLACLLRLMPDTTLEKFGSAINASIFDASNLAGTLKQKSLIDFSSYYPGPNTIVITDIGKALIAEADTKSTEPFDSLDQEVLFQISGGKRIPIELQNTLNIRPKDLALRLYKSYKQGMLTYELKSGGAALLLTESGFLNAKGTAAAKPQMAAQPADAPQIPQATPQTLEPMPQGSSPTRQNPDPVQDAIKQHNRSQMMFYSAIIIVLAILVVALYYFVILQKPI